MNIRHEDAPIRLMEVCGTHTSVIVRGGVRALLPESVRLVSGPGCPVCVTGRGYIDALLALAAQGCAICTFGDMIKVPGSTASLAQARAQGADVRMVYSPFDMLRLAREEPERQFVFAAVGFETIAPVYALLVQQFAEAQIKNARLLTALKRITPALDVLAHRGVDGFIAPGHVAAVTGWGVFAPLAHALHRPFCVAGFTPRAVTAAICDLIAQIENKTHDVHNLYPSVVTERGNEKALALMERVFTPGGATWRGLGEIAESGLYLREEFARFDAGSRDVSEGGEDGACRCGQVLCGEIAPADCPLFGTVCTPMHARGPCMVSGEGACGIWYQCGGGAV